jgi:carbon-monoxide dehydrogenase large subunit
MQFGIGQSVLRVEDHRLLRGQGKFTDDINLPGQAWLHVVRSPHANARIRRIDVETARGAPGVVAVLTGHDYAAEGFGVALIDFLNIKGGDFRYRAGTELRLPENSVLATERVRFVGDNVVLVVAETREQACDAGELVEIDYEPLPSVSYAVAALEPDAPPVWDDAHDNLCADVEYGDEATCEAAFAAAARVVSIDVVNNRVILNPMEPRGAIGDYDGATGLYTVYTTTQIPHRVRTMLADEVFQVPSEKVRVICEDMGGGFGGRGSPYPESLFVAWCAKRLGRSVKWIGERSECFLTDTQGRDNVSHAEIALDADGRFLAIRVSTIANMGAYPGRVGPMVPVILGPRVQTTLYAIPVLYARIRVAFTNTVSIFPYRGAGQPEANYLMERLIEEAARATGLDAIELRRRNHIPADAMPYRTPTGVTYDSGEYDENLRKALVLADWDGFEARKRDSASRGLERGRGIANYIQVAAGAPFEWGAIEVRPDGVVELRSGTHNHGQGHETVFAQVAVEQLGVPFDSVRLVMGDTARIPRGQGAHGSRSMMLAGPLIAINSEKIVDRARRIAAVEFEAAESDIAFAGGRLTVTGTDLSLDLFEVAAIAMGDRSLPKELQGSLAAESDYTTPQPTYPSGTHVCEVEVDKETGSVRIVRFTAIDDVGRAVNPMILFGQSHGGIAQGIGQALLENCCYDAENGQLLSGSLMDYCLPRADDLPSIEVGLHEALSPVNVLGIKGAGESGATGAPPAVVNAIIDALKAHGIMELDMPATPERVWRAIQKLQLLSAASGKTAQT